MALIYFTRPRTNSSRIFIGLSYSDKMYRIGFKTILIDNKLKMVRHHYEIEEEIKIIDNPDKSLISKKDMEYIKFFFNNI